MRSFRAAIRSVPALVAALALLAGPAPARADPDSAIPFRTPGPDSLHILIDAQLGGRGAFTLLLDTGFTAPYMVALSRRAAEAAGARQAPGRSYISRAAVGGPVSFDPWTVGNLVLGPVRLAEVSVGVTAAVDFVGGSFRERLDGVVGHDLLAGRVIEIDYPCRRVDLAATVPDAVPTARFTEAPIRPLMLVSARINGRGPYMLVLDTGAGTSVLSPAAARTAGVALGPPTPLAGAGGVDSGFLSEGAGIALGTAPARQTPLVVSALVERLAQEAGTRIDGVAGATLFGDGVLVLDYRLRRIWLLPPRRCRT